MSRAVFDNAECGRRIAQTKEWMAERRLGAFFVSSPTNMNYLTGCDGWPSYIHQGVVVTRNRNEPVQAGRDTDVSGACVATTLSEESIRSYNGDHIRSPHDLHPMGFVTAVLEDLDVDDARVSLEMGIYYFTAKSYTHLQRNLAGTSFEDTILLVNRMCTKRSDAELDYIRKTARTPENAMRTGLDTIETGVPGYEATEAIYLVLIERTDDCGGDYPSIIPLIPSGSHTGTPHLTWAGRKFEDGDPVIIELSDCRRRYHSLLARMTFVGNPPEELLRQADIVVEGMGAALDAVAPGVTCEAVRKAWRDIVAQYGVEKKSCINYSMGLGYPSGRGERTASLRPGDGIILEEDMMFHAILDFWFGDFGIKLSETFVVTSDGAEPLVDLPRRLFIA